MYASELTAQLRHAQLQKFAYIHSYLHDYALHNHTSNDYKVSCKAQLSAQLRPAHHRYTVEIKAIRPVAAGGGSTLLNGGSVCIFGDGSAC